MLELHLPSLAERPEDLDLLIPYFVSKFAAEYAKRIVGLTPRARLVLGTYSWPGNVRELENALGHACIMTATDVIDVVDLPPHLVTTPAANAEIGDDHPLERQERALVEQALAAAQGNQSRAAASLNIGRDALRYKMKKYGLL